jgi:AcrR family transcriptional regulator
MDIDDLFASFEKSSEMTPERRILLATLGCIGEVGLEATTVRAIAAKAGLNPAAVNYYYRSKDRLIEEALHGIWVHVSDDIQSIIEGEKDPHTAAETIAQYLVEGSWRYPRIIRAIIDEHPKLRLEAATYFKGLFSSLSKRCGSDTDPGLGAAFLLSFAIMLGYGRDVFCLLTGRDLSDREARQRLATELAAKLLSFPSSR